MLEELTAPSNDEQAVERAIGGLYAALYRLRKSGKLKQEYDAMGALLDMLQKDRQHLRSKLPQKDW